MKYIDWAWQVIYLIGWISEAETYLTVKDATHLSMSPLLKR